MSAGAQHPQVSRCRRRCYADFSARLADTHQPRLACQAMLDECGVDGCQDHVGMFSARLLDSCHKMRRQWPCARDPGSEQAEVNATSRIDHVNGLPTRTFRD